MWYVSMAFIVFEVIAGITIAIYFSTRKCRAARKDENKMTERLSIVREDELAEAKAMTDVHDIDEWKWGISPIEYNLNINQFQLSDI